MKLKKFQKLSKNYFFSLQKSKIFEEKKFQQKKYSLFLNIRNMQFDQRSPVQPNPEKKNLDFFLFFFKKSLKIEIFFLPKKMLLS